MWLGLRAQRRLVGVVTALGVVVAACTAPSSGGAGVAPAGGAAAAQQPTRPVEFVIALRQAVAQIFMPATCRASWRRASSRRSRSPRQ